MKGVMLWSIQDTLTQKLGKEISKASNEEIYSALLETVPGK